MTDSHDATNGTIATIGDFEKLDIRIGTVVRAEPFAEARKPALRLWIDFGAELGEQRSSAQITMHYDPDELIGRQVAAVVNFPPRRVAGFESQVLVLGAVPHAGEVILLGPDRPVANGSRVA